MAQRLSHRMVAQCRSGPEVLHWQSALVPRPGAGEVLVRTLAAGVSGYALMIRAHWFPGEPLGARRARGVSGQACRDPGAPAAGGHRELLDLLAIGTIVPLIASRYRLAGAAGAHEGLQQDGVAGTLVLVADEAANGTEVKP